MERATTGIEGLDHVLLGGLTAGRLYLVEGMPGSGKTTLAFQFLLEGVRRGESTLYVTLSETLEEIQQVANSHAWDLGSLAILELSPNEAMLQPEEEYSVFHPAEIELSVTTQKIIREVERMTPKRVVLDSLSELRLLAGSALRYRRQVLALKHFFSGRGCTVLVLDDMTAADHDLQVQSIAHGALKMDCVKPAFGVTRRTLSVTKFRGSRFRDGFHDYVIREGGLHVYPRLVAAEHRGPSSRERLGSGLREMDLLLGGGLERGTSTLIQGASGTGKSTIAALYAANAAAAGQHAAMFIFDESVNTLIARTEGVSISLRQYRDEGRVTVRQVDPAEMSPGVLMHAIRQEVEVRHASIIVIDSLNGYLQAAPDEQFLILQLHELLSYLGQCGVATILISTQLGLLAQSMTTPIDASYLADTVMLLRYFEDAGEVRQALSVVKMRGGEHERTIRDFSMKGGKIRIGEPLRDYHGVLSGVPTKKSAS